VNRTTANGRPSAIRPPADPDDHWLAAYDEAAAIWTRATGCGSHQFDMNCLTEYLANVARAVKAPTRRIGEHWSIEWPQPVAEDAPTNGCGPVLLVLWTAAVFALGVAVRWVQ
jgi:hypothetical protein